MSTFHKNTLEERRTRLACKRGTFHVSESWSVGIGNNDDDNQVHLPHRIPRAHEHQTAVGTAVFKPPRSRNRSESDFSFSGAKPVVCERALLLIASVGGPTLAALNNRLPRDPPVCHHDLDWPSPRCWLKVTSLVLSHVHSHNGRSIFI